MRALEFLFFISALTLGVDGAASTDAGTQVVGVTGKKQPSTLDKVGSALTETKNNVHSAVKNTKDKVESALTPKTTPKKLVSPETEKDIKVHAMDTAAPFKSTASATPQTVKTATPAKSETSAKIRAVTVPFKTNRDKTQSATIKLHMADELSNQPLGVDKPIVSYVEADPKVEAELADQANELQQFSEEVAGRALETGQKVLANEGVTADENIATQTALRGAAKYLQSEGANLEDDLTEDEFRRAQNQGALSALDLRAGGNDMTLENNGSKDQPTQAPAVPNSVVREIASSATPAPNDPFAFKPRPVERSASAEASDDDTDDDENNTVQVKIAKTTSSSQSAQLNPKTQMAEEQIQNDHGAVEHTDARINMTTNDWLYLFLGLPAGFVAILTSLIFFA